MHLKLQFECTAPEGCPYHTPNQCIEPAIDDELPRVCPYLQATNSEDKPLCFGYFQNKTSERPCLTCELAELCSEKTADDKYIEQHGIEQP